MKDPFKSWALLLSRAGQSGVMAWFAFELFLSIPGMAEAIRLMLIAFGACVGISAIGIFIVIGRRAIQLLR